MGWLSDISSDKEHFDKAALIYSEALKNSGFNETLKFLPTIPTRFHRGRNIWFNLPFSSNVKTNVAKVFKPLLSYLMKVTRKSAIDVCLT